MICGRWPAMGVWTLTLACAGADPGKATIDTDASVEPGDSGGETCPPADRADVSGCLEVEESDPEARGRWPDIVRRQYNASGRELSRDTRGGEQPDTERVCRTEWDGDRMLSERCAGIAVYAYEYAYDADGHLVETTYDAGADSALDKVWRHLTDADGNVLESTVDDDADGSIDASQTFAYNGDGHLIEETWDYTYDGSVDYRRTLTWSGSLLMSELEDSDGDGTPDKETVFEYDELDRVAASFVYNGGSSTAAETVRWTYVNCVLDSRVVIDAGGNRTEFSYTFDDDGRQVMLVEDWAGDGTPDRIWATEWICPGGTR